jgi:hypothetical protein
VVAGDANAVRRREEKDAGANTKLADARTGGAKRSSTAAPTAAPKKREGSKNCE